MSTFQENFIKGKVSTVNAIFKWELPNFCIGCKEFGSQHWSPVFHCNNSKWQIQLFPRGDREDSKEFVSAYLWLRGGDIVEANFELSLVNEKNEVNVLHKDKQKFATKKGQGTHTFVKQGELKDKKNGYLVDETLKILCKISVDETRHVRKKSVDFSPNKRPRLAANDPRSNGCNFEKFFKNELLSDVKFVAKDGRCIQAHKTVLANRSDVFLEMSAKMSKDTDAIELQDVDYEVLEEMLRFMYTNEVVDLPNYAAKLLIVAVKYEVEGLKLVCEANLWENLTVGNVVEGLVTARTHKLTKLEEKAVDFMAAHMKDLVDEPAFKSVTNLHPDVIVEIFRRTAECKK